ncbi:MAG: Mn2+ and Fe2+ transporter of the NRAMP family [Candidatus Methanohalarchaeum thermophilum]|uniref:Mn2+ and Fe2+ transporter of the NRAMP family n=1 Tax=Methanohalarchaeum thermophilum TaxID=1903181 RepID=A0A1Q6DSC5_METT1|nr:MAG: Mn2+ and Fe2+ transporter of the NRAMP family [Candidatus Methanohalarchaeum thermophilum]
MSIEENEELNYPEESLKGFFKEHFGPSILWALMGIGASHIIIAPVLGAKYGIFAIWMIVGVYLVKYGAWDLGIIYNYGHGRNPVEGYGDLPGPKNWGRYFTLFIYLGAWTIILGAVGTGAASFISALIPGLGMVNWYLVLIGLAIAFLLVTGYNVIENVLKVFVIALAPLIILGLIITPPSPETITQTAFRIPDLTSAAFLSLFAAAAGYMPTGLSTTISIGSWSLAKKEGASALRNQGKDPSKEKYHEYIKKWIKTGKRDFKIGFGFSLILIISTTALAASVLYPRGIIPSGGKTPIVIGNLLKNLLGTWAFPVVGIAAFAALYSTVLTVLDGASRVASDIIPMIKETKTNTEKWRKTFIILMPLASIIPVLSFGELPVVITTFSAGLMAIFGPFFYFANYYIVKKHLPKKFHPTKKRTTFYITCMIITIFFGIIGAIGKLGLLGL